MNNPSTNGYKVRRVLDLVEGLSTGVDEQTDTKVLLREFVTDEQAKKARLIGSLGVSQVPEYLGEAVTDRGKVLVLKDPEPLSCYFPLVPGQALFSTPRVVEIGKSLIALTEALAEHGYRLSCLFAEDIIFSNQSETVYLTNFDNVEPAGEVDSNRAEADIARLLMQLTLNCAYPEVRNKVNRGADGCYRLHDFPKGLDPRVKTLVKSLVPWSFRRCLRVWAVRLSPLGGAVIGALVAMFAPKAIWLETGFEAYAVTQAAQDGLEDFQYHGCLYAIENGTQGFCDNLDLAGQNFSGKDFSKISLDKTLLSGADLTEAKLSGLTLRGTNFTGAILRGADIRWVTDKDVVWGTADLMGADLSGSKLVGSDFSKAFLGEVRLSGADISQANMSGVNLSNQTLSGVTAVDTVFEGANLHGVTFEGGQFVRASFNGAQMDSTIFKNVLVDESLFQSTSLNAARFLGAKVFSSSFYNADLEEVIITDSRFSGTTFTESDLYQLTATNSAFSGGSFVGSDLRLGLFQGSKVEAMDFSGVKARSLKFVNSDLSRSSNIPDYFFFGVSYRNVVMPNGEVKNPRK